jgi:hypothetical protein
MDGMKGQGWSRAGCLIIKMIPQKRFTSPTTSRHDLSTPVPAMNEFCNDNGMIAHPEHERCMESQTII